MSTNVVTVEDVVEVSCVVNGSYESVVEYMSGIEPKEFPGKGTKVSCLSYVGP